MVEQFPQNKPENSNEQEAEKLPTTPVTEYTRVEDVGKLEGEDRLGLRAELRKNGIPLKEETN